MAAALRVLNQDIAREETARLLIACVSGKAPAAAPDAFIRQLKHRSPRVHRDALTALTAACKPAAEIYVAQALADPDENVRARALLLCATTGGDGEKTIPRAVGRKTPPAAVSIMAVGALARLGTGRAQRVVARLAHSKARTWPRPAGRRSTRKTTAGHR